MDRIKKAKYFCILAHKGQLRKYTGEPYHVHPFEVAEIVKTVSDDENIYIAALLHDVVEDTSYTLDDISNRFGQIVANMVEELTDVSKPSDGNRKARKAIDRQRLANASNNSKTIKLADLISNSKSITEHDADFSKVYMAEKRLLLEDALVGGDEKLYRWAKSIVDDYYK